MTVDVHAHFCPAGLLEALRAKGQDFGIDVVDTPPTCACHFDYGLKVRPFFAGLLDLDLRLSEMDRQGVDRQVLSTWTDIFGYGMDVGKNDAWHRVLNDTLAELSADHPDKFSWMASAPLCDGTLAAEEMHRAAREGAVGLIVPGNVEGANLGDLPLDELWSACEELSMPVFIHPALPEPQPRTGKYGLNQTSAYTLDTTLGVASMMLNGVLDRHPKLSVLLSHGGGNLPYLIGRFDRVHEAMDRSKTGDVAALKPSEYLPRMLYDTILHAPASLHFLLGLVGEDRLLLGSDMPFPPGDPDPLATLRAAGFDEALIHKITEENPRRHYAIP